MRLNRCRLRVMIVFGVLLLAALAFPPVRNSTVAIGRDPVTNAVWRKTSASVGLMFAPAFMRHRNDPLPDEQSYAVRYALRRSREIRATQIRLNVTWWILELGLIVVLGLFDSAVFCRRRGRRSVGPPSAAPPVPL